MHGQVGHVLPVDVDAPRIRPHQADDHVERRGLARAVGPEQADDFAAAHAETDIAHHLSTGIALLQMLHVELGTGRAHLTGAARRSRHHLGPSDDRSESAWNHRRIGRPGLRTQGWPPRFGTALSAGGDFGAAGTDAVAACGVIITRTRPLGLDGVTPWAPPSTVKMSVIWL
ncbi:hypothetical protein GALL_500920 [mine drainage metagenome]|uniref:Uncharacterized protein n=1 Tax=mine drainage metagenome TaxID=410659 RepID=A0A1J5PC49_9ZZZZ